jgi:hypothetical protein
MAQTVEGGRGERGLPARGQVPIQAELQPDIRVQAEQQQQEDQQEQ